MKNYADLGGEYLEHYGVKGMKWRRKKNSMGNDTSLRDSMQKKKDKENRDLHETGMAMRKAEDTRNKMNKLLRNGRTSRIGVTAKELNNMKISKKDTKSEKIRKAFNSGSGSQKLAISNAVEFANRRKKKK